MIFLILLRRKEFFQLSGPSLAASPCIFFLCRFPSMVNTVRFSRNLFVVGEDEYNNICAVSGNHPIDVIIYGMQSRLQDNILQLYHSGSQHDMCFFFMSALLVLPVLT